MHLNLKNLMEIIIQLSETLSLNAAPDHWDIATVDKSWSHYSTLEKFHPQTCTELQYFKNDAEFYFLVSPILSPEENTDRAEWIKAEALTIELPQGEALYILRINGKPVHTYNYGE